MAQRKAEGVVTGRPRTLAPDVAARITAARIAAQSFASIARNLNAKGVPTAQGRQGVARVHRSARLDGATARMTDDRSASNVDRVGSA